MHLDLKKQTSAQKATPNLPFVLEMVVLQKAVQFVIKKNNIPFYYRF